MLRKALHLSDAARKFNAKLTEKYEDPYEVVEILSPTVYVLGQGGWPTDGSPRCMCLGLSVISYREVDAKYKEIGG